LREYSFISKTKESKHKVIHRLFRAYLKAEIFIKKKLTDVGLFGSLNIVSSLVVP